MHTDGIPTMDPADIESRYIRNESGRDIWELTGYDPESCMATEVHGLVVQVAKVGGGTVGRAYGPREAWIWEVSADWDGSDEQFGTRRVLGAGDATVPHPSTHAGIAQTVSEYFHDEHGL